MSLTEEIAEHFIANTQFSTVSVEIIYGNVIIIPGKEELTIDDLNSISSYISLFKEEGRFTEKLIKLRVLHNGELGITFSENLLDLVLN